MGRYINHYGDDNTYGDNNLLLYYFLWFGPLADSHHQYSPCFLVYLSVNIHAISEDMLNESGVLGEVDLRLRRSIFMGEEFRGWI